MNTTFGKSPIYGPTGSSTNIYLNKDFYFEKSTKKDGWYTTLHSHKFHEIYYLISGKTDYFIKDKSYALEAGSVVFIPANTLHKTLSAGSDRKRYLIHFTDNTLGIDPNILKEVFRITEVNIPLKKRVIFESILEKALYEDTHGDEYSTTLQVNMFQEFLLRLLRIQKTLIAPEQIAVPSYITEVLQYINANFSTPLSVADLSKMVFMNESQLSRTFKRVNGIGINEYINSLRILQAEKLLTDTNMPITDIAHACGFNSSSYFTATFKSIKGITPLKYRNLPQMIY